MTETRRYLFYGHLRPDMQTIFEQDDFAEKVAYDECRAKTQRHWEEDHKGIAAKIIDRISSFVSKRKRKHDAS